MKTNVPSTKIIDLSSREQLHVGIEEFRGKQFFSIRKYYLDGDSNTYKPSPKGITLPFEIATKVLSAGRKFREYMEGIEEETPPKKVKEATITVSKKAKPGAKPADASTKRKIKTEIDDEDRPDPEPKRSTGFGGLKAKPVKKNKSR